MFTPSPPHCYTAYSVARLRRHALLLFLTLLFQVSALAAQNDKDASPLELNKPVTRELGGGQAHTYRFMLTSGQYLHVVVEQRGIDVVVTLFGPDEQRIVNVDSPNGTQGPEPVSWVAETNGSYRLEVSALDKTAAAGHYEVQLPAILPATAQ